MLDETKVDLGTGARQQLLQPHLAIGQRHRSQILAAIEEKVEGKIDEGVSFAFGKSSLKSGEIRRAIFIQGAYFAIDDDIRQIACGPRDSWIFGGPIEAFASFQGHVAAKHAQLNAVAIEFDLVNPTV